MESHNLEIVIILTVGFGLASLFAYIARRLKLPAILGYLLAGYAIGPYSPGFVANITLAEQLAEIGVVLMLFGVGLHFKFQDLLEVKDIAIPGAAGQTLIATLVTVLFLTWDGWLLGPSIIMGLAIGVASTVVLVRVMTDNHLLNTKEGHIAIGWLIVEDIFTVVILILLPTIAALSSAGEMTFLPILGLVLLVFAKFAALVVIMFTVGHKLIDKILTSVARLRSQELFILTVLALLFVIAIGSAFIFGTSIALGAFIAGMVIGKTTVRHQAAANSLPFKDIFAVVFFLSAGMLFNPNAVFQYFHLFLAISFIILIVKPVTAYLIAYMKGCSFRVAMTVALSLAQIGEFSFILSEQAMNLNLMPDEGFDILVACAILSISINPLFFPLIDYFDRYRTKAKLTDVQLNPFPPEYHENLNVVIVGYGPIGRAVAELTDESGYKPIIIENNIDTVSDLEEEYEILFGDAAEAMILKEAHLERANYLIITIPDTLKTLAIIDAARHVNPHIEVIARINYLKDQELMDELNIRSICSEQETLKEFMDRIPRIFRPENPFS